MTTRHVAWLGLSACLLASACDPPSVEASAVTKADPATATESDGKGDFVVCMAACAAGERLSPTDRATCRLACEPADPSAPAAEPTAAATALMRFDTCDEACASEGTATDRATCRLNCAHAAVTSANAPGLGEAARQCSAACLEGLVGCEDACPHAAADRATCGLHCETDVTRCLGHCEAGPGT